MKQFAPSLFCKPIILLFLFLFTLNQSLSAQWTEAEIKKAEAEKRKEGKNYGYGSVALFVGCFAIGIWLKQRQLKRTNKYGTETFTSNKEFYAKSFVEGLANIAAVILFFGGLLLMIAAVIKCNA